MKRKQPWQKALKKLGWHNTFAGELLKPLKENPKYARWVKALKLCQKETIKRVFEEIDEWIRKLKKERTIFKRVIDKNCYDFAEEELKSLKFNLKKRLLELE